MFGASNPFGQSSGSPFGSQTPFGQTSNAAPNNPFAPKPFGSTAPFGSPQTGSSMFGGTATGMFGAPQSSSAFSTPTFGASSSPAFGASSAPAPSFGGSSSPFGGSSGFGQKPSFGGFGSTGQANPFGSTSQPSQPAFGGGVFGSTTPFGASSQPAFGAASTPTFGSTSMPAFSSTNSPSFGTISTPTFGATSAPGFGAQSTSAFGASSAPAFGSTTTPTFGNTGLAFGVSSTPTFGSGGAFGSSSTSAFGASSTPGFNFASSTGFAQSASAIGSSPFASTPSSFGAQTSSFGAQATTPAFGTTNFGQPSFGAQRGGTRVTPYTATTEAENAGGQLAKLESISAMPAYKEKSHEELRWEDYQLGDKGGQTSAGQSLGGVGFGVSSVQPNPFSSSTFTQTAASPFSTSTSTSIFGSKPSAFGPSATSAFSASAFSSSPNVFQSTSTSASIFGTPSTSQPPFGTTASSTFGSTPSLFSSSTPAAVSSFASGLNFSNTQTSAFQSTFATGGTSSSVGLTSTFNQPNLFSAPTSAGFGPSNLFSNTSSNISSANFGILGQTNQPQSMPFQSPQPSQTSSAFNFSNIGQPQAGGSSLFSGTSSMPQNSFGQWSTTSSTVAVQPVSITNPFGTLPTMPQISIGRAGTTPSIQYGISSMPVVDKPAPVRISSLLTSRHLSQRRIRLPARKYNPKHDGPKVPFFAEEEETPSTPKADALFVPRENPRALFIRPMDQWPSRATVDKSSPLKDVSPPSAVHENGKVL
ncbi:hypothetical protein Tsubulata_024456 [Turnera subulata]|uniref:Peptidase S59 domain-containing protein n=1 Tax=Turnera subulata TaxID=218843 RepID=A0A9Q0F567_9ROSI|nr:hypothetical protein Tsubulata_024456 [Turnera subulata]